MSLIVSPPPSSLKSTSFKKESDGKLPETPEGREEGDELDDDELVLQQTYPDPGPPQNGGLGPKGPNSENNLGQGMEDYGSKDRMCCPINWSKIDTSYWLRFLILKLYWSNLKLCFKAMSQYNILLHGSGKEGVCFLI